MQQVEELGHSNWLPGHWTAPKGLVSDLRKQECPSALQWKPLGQQWRPSPHDMAYGTQRAALTRPFTWGGSV